MSVTSDVALLIRQKDYNELKERINTQGLDDYEVDLFNRAHKARVCQTDFIVLFWKYVKWDAPTNEMVDLVEAYIDMYEKNNIPFRYVVVGEFNIIDRKAYGIDPDDIPIIETSIYPKSIVGFSLKVEDFDNGVAIENY